MRYHITAGEPRLGEQSGCRARPPLLVSALVGVGSTLGLRFALVALGYLQMAPSSHAPLLCVCPVFVGTSLHYFQVFTVGTVFPPVSKGRWNSLYNLESGWASDSGPQTERAML